MSKGAGWGQAVQAVGGIAGGLISNAGNKARQRRSFQQEKKMMGIQFQNQQTLNRQGADLQYEMWQKTNAPAQMAMLREAGLNPALMYGQSGAGGQTTTGSQGGGTASKGNAPNPIPMDIGSAVAAAKVASEILVNKATAKKLEADAENTRGGEGTIGQSQIALYQQQRKTETQRSGLVLQQAVAEAEKVVKLSRENEIGDATKNNMIKGIALDTVGKELENQLKKANINMTEKQIEELGHRIYQNWVKAGSMAVGGIGVLVGNAIKALGKGK